MKYRQYLEAIMMNKGKTNIKITQSIGSKKIPKIKKDGSLYKNTMPIQQKLFQLLENKTKLNYLNKKMNIKYYLENDLSLISEKLKKDGVILNIPNKNNPYVEVHVNCDIDDADYIDKVTKIENLKIIKNYQNLLLLIKIKQKLERYNRSYNWSNREDWLSEKEINLIETYYLPSKSDDIHTIKQINIKLHENGIIYII